MPGVGLLRAHGGGHPGVGVRTDTRLIPVIDVEPVCSWCHIPLGRIRASPVYFPHGTFHPSCVEADRLAWEHSSATL